MFGLNCVRDKSENPFFCVGNRALRKKIVANSPTLTRQIFAFNSIFYVCSFPLLPPLFRKHTKNRAKCAGFTCKVTHKHYPSFFSSLSFSFSFSFLFFPLPWCMPGSITERSATMWSVPGTFCWAAFLADL